MAVTKSELIRRAIEELFAPAYDDAHGLTRLRPAVDAVAVRLPDLREGRAYATVLPLP